MDTPEPPAARPPFNELSVLAPLLAIYTSAYLALVTSDFLLREALELPGGLMPMYIALLGAYAADKEIRRWADRPEPPRKGTVFVYLWTLLYLAAFILHTFRPDFAMPPELGKVALQVLAIFFGSRASKILHNWRSNRKDTTDTTDYSAYEQQVLDLVRTRGPIRSQETAEALGVSLATAKRILTWLAGAGKLKVVGGGRYTAYALAEALGKN